MCFGWVITIYTPTLKRAQSVTAIKTILSKFVVMKRYGRRDGTCIMYGTCRRLFRGWHSWLVLLQIIESLTNVYMTVWMPGKRVLHSTSRQWSFVASHPRMRGGVWVWGVVEGRSTLAAAVVYNNGTWSSLQEHWKKWMEFNQSEQRIVDFVCSYLDLHYSDGAISSSHTHLQSFRMSPLFH